MAKTNPGAVPGWCVALLTRCVPGRLSRESLLGDLEAEADAIVHRRGPRAARTWLRWEALAIAARYVWARLRQSLHPTPPSPFLTHPRDRFSFMNTLLQDVVYGIRSLRSTPGTTAALLFILVLGIGALVATFSLVEAALLRPLPYPDQKSLVWAATTFEGYPNPVGSAPDWADYRERSNSFSDFGAITPFFLPVTVVTEREPSRVKHAYATWNLFRTLGVEPVLGRWFTEAEGELGATVAMVSHDFWQEQLGGESDVIGESVRVDGEAHSLVGVMPSDFHFLLDVDVWRPMQLGGPFASARRFHNWLMIGRLRDGVSLEQAQSDVDVISRDLQLEYPDSNETKALSLTPLADAIASSVGPQLLLMMATAGLVLAVAGSNVASLLLARGSTRQAELAIRAALGASRGRILRQLTVESLVLGLVAGTGGIVAANWLSGLMLRVIPLSVLGIEHLDMSVTAVLFGIAVTVVISLLFGTAPALRVIPDRPSETLRSGRGTVGAGNRLRSGLVIAQVAVAVVLLVGSALLVRSFVMLRGQNPGFSPGQLLSAEINLSGSQQESLDERRIFFDQLATRLEALPGVEAVALANQLPIRNPGNNISIWDADAPPDSVQKPLAYQRIVRQGYFEAMQIPLVAGRTFGPGSGTQDELQFVLSRTLADMIFPGGGAVGKRVSPDWGDGVVGLVVGVVEDVRVAGLGVGGTDSATFYASYDQRPMGGMNIAIRTRGEPGSIVPELRAIMHELDPTVPLGDIRAMEDLIADSIGQPRLMSLAMGLFSATALVLSLVGLYGILAQAVTQRRREFGLRVALGAERGNIVAIVVRSGMLRVGLGLAVGIPAALASSRMLEGFLFNVAPVDPIAFASVAVLLTAVGLIACLAPAWRALRVDPVISLRAE